MFNPAISDFNQVAEVKIRIETNDDRDRRWEALTCQELYGVFITERGDIEMPCTSSPVIFRWVEFTLPETYLGQNLTLFRQSIADKDQYVKIKCRNKNKKCRSNDFVISMQYNTIVESPVHGTDSLRMTEREYIETGDAFRVDMYLRLLEVTEYDKLAKPANSTLTMNIQRNPQIFSA